jgi:hypothetical protein
LLTAPAFFLGDAVMRVSRSSFEAVLCAVGLAAVAGCNGPATTRSIAPGGVACGAVTAVLQVSGRVQDDVGIATPRAQVQLCPQTEAGSTCLDPVLTDHAGAFEIALPADAQCLTGGTVRVIHAGSATTYCSLPTEAKGGLVQLPRPLILHRTAPAGTVPPAGGLVEFSGGVSLEADPARVDAAGYAQLAARMVDPDQVCDPLAFDGVVAFSPEMDIRGQGFDLHIQSGLAPLTTVALFVRGGQNCTLYDGATAPESEWIDFGTGIVDEAGVLHATGTNALPCLGWLGWHVIGEGDANRRPPEVDLPPVDPEPSPGPGPEPGPEGEPEAEPDVIEPPEMPPVDPETLPRPGPPNAAVAPEFRAIDAPPETGVPTIEMLEPLDGSVHLVNTPITIRARITDAEGLRAADLVWAFNGQRYPCPTDGENVQCTLEGDEHIWTVTAGSAGPRAFSVRARNDRGRVTRAPERIASVRTRLDAEPPRIIMVDPTPDTVWQANSLVNIRARITDDGSVASAELLWAYNNNRYPCPHESRYVNCTVQGAEYHWVVEVGTGTRAFQLEVADDEGNTTLSPTRTLVLE